MKARRMLWAAIALLTVLPLASAAEEAKPASPRSAEKGICPPVPPPSMDYVISEMTAKGQVEDKVAKFDMKLKIEVLADRKQQVRFLTGDISIAKFSVSGGFMTKGVYLARTATGVDLLIEQKGKYDIDLSFVQRIKEVKSEKSIVLPLAPAVKSVVELTVPLPDVEVKTEPEISFETKKVSDKACVVTVYGTTTDAVALKWTPKAPERELAPIVFADQTALMEVGRGVLRVDSTIDYSILQGKINKLTVKLPKDCSLLSLEGKEIRSWDIAEAAGEKTLKIDLIGEVKESHQLSLKIEKALSKVPVVFEAPKIEVMDVAREKGFIAVTAAKGVQIEASDVKDISQIDVRDLPATMNEKAREALLAFKYLKRPFEIKLSASEVEAKVAVEVFTNVKASLDVLRLSSQMVYQIRDAGVFNLNIQLVEGLKLIDVKGENINNWELDPKTRVLRIDLRSKAEGGYLLSLETEMELKETQRVTIPAIQPMGVERERGFIAVSAAPGIRVESVDIKGASQIDVKELPDVAPQAQQTQRGEAAALAFRYIKPGYQIVVAISEVQPEVEAEVRSLATIDEKEMNVVTDVLYKIRKAGVFQLKLKIPKDLRRQDVVGEDIDEQSWDDTAGVLTVSLKKKVEGDYQLKIEAQKTLEDLKKGIDVPVIGALDVKKERGFVAVKTKASIRVKPAEGKMTGLDDIDITELPWDVQSGGGTVALAFKYFTPPWSLSLAVEEIEARVTAETFNFVSIGEKLVQVSATVKYSILHAGVEQFKVKMPTGAENVDIKGEAIRHKDEDKKTGTWTVSLQSKKTGEYRLFFSFQQKIAGGDKVEYTGVQALGVERDTGYLAVAARSDVEISPDVEATKKLTPIDEREIPAEYKVGITIPILVAYRYLEHPYAAVFLARVHNPAEVTVAIIETCKLETTVTKIGETITDFVCVARNSRQQYLEMELPPSATIDHAFVGGEPVTPLQERRPKPGAKPIAAAPAAKAEDAKTEGAAAVEPPASIPTYRDEDTVVVTMLPIARAGKSDEAFEVRLRYRSKRGELGVFGVLDMTCPRINIGIMRLGWEVSLPDGYRIVSDSGNMTRMEHSGYFESQLQTLRCDVSVNEMKRISDEPAAAAKPNAWDVQSDINKANVAGLEQRASGQGGKGGTSQRSIYTGRRPDLPTKFYFQSLIVSPDEPGHIHATYMKANVTIPFYGLILVGVIAACCLVWRRMKFSELGRFGIFLAAAVVVLGVRTLAEGAFEGLLNVVMGGIVLFDAAMGLAALSRGFQKWQASRPPSPPRGGFSSFSGPPQPPTPSREEVSRHVMPRGQEKGTPVKPKTILPSDRKSSYRENVLPRKAEEEKPGAEPDEKPEEKKEGETEEKKEE